MKRFTSTNPTHISGVGDGSYPVKFDVQLTLNLFTSNNTTIPVDTIAGVVPDDTIPTDILLGRVVHQRLGIQHLNNGSLQAHSIEGLPVFKP